MSILNLLDHGIVPLHDPRDFDSLINELRLRNLSLLVVVRNLQDFDRPLHLLNLGNLCCVTTDTSRILPLCCACARHLPQPVHGNVVDCVDRLHLTHLHCSR